MRTGRGSRQSGKATGRGARAASAATSAVASSLSSLLLLLALPLLASAANSSSSPPSSSPRFPAAATSPNRDRLEKGSLENWSLTSTIVPPPASAADGGGGNSVVLVEPGSVEEVQRVVRDDGGRYPAPLLTVGNGHSSGEVVSLYDPRTGLYRGTVLKTKALRGMSLEEAGGDESGGGGGGGRKRYFVRAGGGVPLADLHDWLADRQLEISFSPEIGDATVGSGAVASMKDSSVAGGADDGDFGEGKASSSLPSLPSSTFSRGPPYPSSAVYKGMGDGYLGALVRGVRYVNASGGIVDLNARRGAEDAKEIRRIQGSFGLMGPVVDVLLETRPLSLVETRVKIVPLEDSRSDLDFAKKLLKLRGECDNMMVCFFFSFLFALFLLLGCSLLLPLLRFSSHENAARAKRRRKKTDSNGFKNKTKKNERRF